MILRKNTKFFLDELRRYNPEMLDKELKGVPYMFISSVAQQGLVELKDKLWQMLNN